MLCFVLAARMLVLAVAYAFPEGGVIIDSRAYLDLASNLRSIGWSALGPDSLHWTPGYPLFLVFSQWLTHTSLVGTYVVQLLLTGASCLVLVWIGGRLGDARAGIAAGLLYAVSPNTALWSLTIMSETLFALLLVLALACWVASLRTDGAAWSLAAGISLGAASFVRPIGLPLVFVWLIATLVAMRDRSAAWPWRRVALLIIGFVFTLAPWAVRNWRATGKLMLADVAGDTFVQFNLASVVAEAKGISRGEAAVLLGQTVHSVRDELAIIREYPGIFIVQQIKGVGRSTIGIESGVWARQLGYDLERQGSLDILSTLMAGTPGLAMDRLAALLRDPETVGLTSLSLLAVLYGGVVLVLAVAGLRSPLVESRSGRAALLLLVLTIAYLILVPGAAGQARFRIPVEPFLALLAGWGTIPISRFLLRRRSSWRTERRREIPGAASP